MVCITGQVTRHLLGTDAFQETDIIGISTPVTKWNYQVTEASEIPEVMAKAEEDIKAELKAEGKPEQIWDKILPGKMDRFISDNTTLDLEQCLLDQAFIKDDKKNVADYVKTYGDVSISGFKRVTLG